MWDRNLLNTVPVSAPTLLDINDIRHALASLPPPHSEPHYILFPPVRDHYSVQTFSPTPSQVSVRDVSPHQAIITRPEVAGEEVKKKKSW